MIVTTAQAVWGTVGLIGAAAVGGLFTALPRYRELFIADQKNRLDGSHQLVTDLQAYCEGLKKDVTELKADVKGLTEIVESERDARLQAERKADEALRLMVQKDAVIAKKDEELQGVNAKLKATDAKLAAKTDEANAYALMYGDFRAGRIPDGTVLSAIEKALTRSGQIPAGEVDRILGEGQ